MNRSKIENRPLELVLNSIPNAEAIPSASHRNNTMLYEVRFCRPKSLKSNINIVQQRFEFLDAVLYKLLCRTDYNKLSESEKIPLRVMRAEIEALKSWIFGDNLETDLSYCVSREQYCGAEGIKLAKEWLINNLKYKK